MGLFTETIRAKMSGREVGISPLAFFDFLGRPTRWWPGFGDLETNDGQTWTGIGDLVSIEGLGRAPSDAAAAVTFHLSGVTPEIIGIAKNSEQSVQGRACIVYAQVFDVTGDHPAYPLDLPFFVWAGVMDVLTMAGTGPRLRAISLTAESENADRRRAGFGLLTDADQQTRHPGDTAMKFRAALKFTYLRQPW